MSKRVWIVIVCVLLSFCVLAGCGKKFDASAYVKAVLDNSYKNDPSGMVNQKVCTKEEAEALYEQGIQMELDAMVADIEVSSLLASGYRETFKDMFAATKYTVGKAEKIDSTTYQVSVEYEQLLVFGPAYEAWSTELEGIQNTFAAGNMTEEQLYEMLFRSLKNQLDAVLKNPSYGEKASTTVTVKLENRVWTPVQEDLEKLGELLFDVDAAMPE